LRAGHRNSRRARSAKSAGQEFDEALAAVVRAGGEIAKAVDQLHALGCTIPSGQQVLSLGERAIRSSIQQTMWTRSVERLAPGERTSFSRLIDSWATAIERSFGEKEEAA
jgi:hypothetical protein